MVSSHSPTIIMRKKCEKCEWLLNKDPRWRDARDVRPPLISYLTQKAGKKIPYFHAKSTRNRFGSL